MKRNAAVATAIVAILLLVVIAWGLRTHSRFDDDLTSYADLRLGSSMAEVKYAWGFPTEVAGPPEFDTVFQDEMQPLYRVDGSDPKNLMPKGKTVEDFNDWSYTHPKNRLDVEFDPKSHSVVEVSCYDNRDNKEDSGCPSLFGVRVGQSEENLRERLGKESRSELKGGVKTLFYDELGLQVLLTKRNVYMLRKQQPKSMPFSAFVRYATSELKNVIN